MKGQNGGIIGLREPVATSTSCQEIMFLFLFMI